MGHDTYAKIGDEEIAYHRYSAGNSDARVLYRCLKIEECDGGCSGNGESVDLDIGAFERAIKNVTSDVYKRTLVDKNYLLRFLNKVVSEMNVRNVSFVTLDLW